jgi:hypothetical protein
MFRNPQALNPNPKKIGKKDPNGRGVRAMYFIYLQ